MSTYNIIFGLPWVLIYFFLFFQIKFCNIYYSFCLLLFLSRTWFLHILLHFSKQPMWQYSHSINKQKKDSLGCWSDRHSATASSSWSPCNWCGRQPHTACAECRGAAGWPSFCFPPRHRLAAPTWPSCRSSGRPRGSRPLGRWSSVSWRRCACRSGTWPGRHRQRILPALVWTWVEAGVIWRKLYVFLY